MAQSLSCIYLHIIFHAKGDARVKDTDLPELHAYVATPLRAQGSLCIKVGGVGDHIHMLTTLPRDRTVADLVKAVKATSSHWLRTDKEGYRHFAWQSGYAAFSVSQSVVGQTKEYIARQAEHHRRRTTREEYVAFLNRYNVAYDEKYVLED